MGLVGFLLTRTSLHLFTCLFGQQPPTESSSTSACPYLIILFHDQHLSRRKPPFHPLAVSLAIAFFLAASFFNHHVIFDHRMVHVMVLLYKTVTSFVTMSLYVNFEVRSSSYELLKFYHFYHNNIV